MRALLSLSPATTACCSASPYAVAVSVPPSTPAASAPATCALLVLGALAASGLAAAAFWSAPLLPVVCARTDWSDSQRLRALHASSVDNGTWASARGTVISLSRPEAADGTRCLAVPRPAGVSGASDACEPAACRLRVDEPFAGCAGCCGTSTRTTLQMKLEHGLDTSNSNSCAGMAIRRGKGEATYRVVWTLLLA